MTLQPWAALWTLFAMPLSPAQSVHIMKNACYDRLHPGIYSPQEPKEEVTL